MNKGQKKILVDLIKLDLSTVFSKFVEQVNSRSEVSERLFVQLDKGSLGSYMDHTKKTLAMQIGEYMIENGFIEGIEREQFDNNSIIVDSTVYTIKPGNIGKFLEAIASYIVDRWLNEPKGKN